jgi:UDP-N-acetylmuramate--alanine ligase
MPAENALDLGVPRRIHIVGIGGAGMSAIALVLRDMGHHVSGS